jgi:hypothetical protein
MERREFLLSAGGIVGATAIGSVAYTEATVDRSVTAEVAADDSAIIGLTAGTPSAIYKNNDGQLEIDTTVSDASGLNTDGEFVYGDSDDPTGTPGFSITNNDADPHDLTVSLSNMTEPASSSFEIELYEDDGTDIGTVDSSTDQTYQGWTSSETIYAVVVIDTEGMSWDSDAIGGTLRFEAGPDTS